MAVSKVNFTFLDRFSKTSGVGFATTAFTSANYDTIGGLLDDLSDAIEAVTLLALTKDQRIAGEAKFSPATPTDDNAVIGNRWLVRMTDTNGNAVVRQIPGADLSLAGAGGEMDLSAGAGLALKTAIEAVAKSNDGEAVTVQQVIYLDK